MKVPGSVKVPALRRMSGVVKAGIGLGLALLAGLGHAQNLAQNLPDIYQLAQQRDPVYRSARHALQAALEKVPQARSGLLPTLNTTGSSSRSHGAYLFSPAPESGRNVNAWNWSLQLTQPLVRVQNWRALTQAEAAQQLAQLQFALAEQDLVVRTAQAYFDVVVAQQGVVVADAQIRALEETLAQNRRGFALGTHTVTDVYEAQARHALARAQRVTAQNELTARQADLEKLTGSLPATLEPLPVGDKPQPVQPDDLLPWVDQARQNALAVRIQQAAVAVAEAEVARNSAGHLPTVDLTASYGRNFSSGSSSTPVDYTTRSRSGQYGIQVNIPLYAGGAVDSKVRETLQLLEQARSDLETAQRTAVAQARQSFSAVQAAQAQALALEAAIESSRAAIKGNQAGVRLGTRINADVLNAEQQLYAAQRDLVKARYEALLQGLKLKAAAGSLMGVDLLGMARGL